jgi:hypothetical protein
MIRAANALFVVLVISTLDVAVGSCDMTAYERVDDAHENAWASNYYLVLERRRICA